MPLTSSAALPQSFLHKKRKILDQLAVPQSEYDDLSPKGSIDEAIRELIDEINGFEGLVTTSSCAGRISVFLEGRKKSQEGDDGNGDEEVVSGLGGEPEGLSREKGAGVGGKGGGGRWLFVSHESLQLEEDKSMDLAKFLGMERDGGSAKLQHHARDRRFIHYKFEPMVSQTM